MSSTNYHAETESRGASEMNGGRANCILGVCCGSMADRQQALAADLMRDVKSISTPQGADQMAAYILAHYDLAPKGSLTPLYAQIAKLAREGFVKAT